MLEYNSSTIPLNHSRCWSFPVLPELALSFSTAYYCAALTVTCAISWRDNRKEKLWGGGGCCCFDNFHLNFVFHFQKTTDKMASIIKESQRWGPFSKKISTFQDKNPSSCSRQATYVLMNGRADSKWTLTVISKCCKSCFKPFDTCCLLPSLLKRHLQEMCSVMASTVKSSHVFASQSKFDMSPVHLNTPLHRRSLLHFRV